MSEPVVAFKRIDPDSPVEAEKAYLKIEMAAELGSQKLHFSTVLDRDAPISQLKAQLERLSNAADWLGLKYSVRNSRVELNEIEKELTRMREDHAAWHATQQDQWTGSGRRGEFKLHGNQQNTDSNYRNSIHQREERIRTLRHSITVAEAILNAANE